ncbi:hypothetical protein FIBSPDRAFT_878193 [Athelia psychrophila]|uniref:Uncharacterized protein n=1 Tax=Athelia psychrophila TaxID=1759441 RepID=A0A167V7Z5_9AGAM|nr:hypothetical protein FIBSPDRAFT_878193 [Fibularhizoctonia sp. CBS 109695]
MGYRCLRESRPVRCHSKLPYAPSPSCPCSLPYPWPLLIFKYYLGVTFSIAFTAFAQF